MDEPSMDETILVGDDLMTVPSSPIIPPEIASHVLEGIETCDGILRNFFLPSEGQTQRPTLEVVEIYKSSVYVNPILGALGVDIWRYFSASEATDIVSSYVEHSEYGKDKAIVVLDATLCDALFKGTIKKGSTYPTEIHKKDLGADFLSRMQPHHRVTRGGEFAVRKGALKTVQIVTERRQGNKKVTRLSGLDSFLLDAEVLASELQKKFACSTTVA